MNRKLFRLENTILDTFDLEKPMSCKEVAEKHGLSLCSLTSAVKKLFDKGYMIRVSRTVEKNNWTSRYVYTQKLLDCRLREQQETKPTATSLVENKISITKNKWSQFGSDIYQENMLNQF